MHLRRAIPVLCSANFIGQIDRLSFLGTLPSAANRSGALRDEGRIIVGRPVSRKGIARALRVDARFQEAFRASKTDFASCAPP